MPFNETGSSFSTQFEQQAKRGCSAINAASY
jgi:hypothetical protein